MSLLARAGLLAALVLSSCGVTHVDDLALPPTYEVELRKTWYVRDEVPRTERSVRLYSDGRIVTHGAERSWFRDGQLEKELTFDDGVPTGVWRTWYPDGSPRSELEMGEEPRPMRFWYEDGTLEAEGQGVLGVREGLWTYYHRNGRIASTGPFRAGVEEGHWRYFDEEGNLEEEGRYEKGRRTGVWERPLPAPDAPGQ